MADTPIPNLLQFLENRNREIKDKVASIYMKNATEMLMKPPFCYSESISSEVAEGIVNYGDKLTCNCGEGDERMDEVNGIGDEFQALQKSITLKVISGDGYDMDVSSFITTDEYYTSVSMVTSFVDTLLAVRAFLKTKAQRGFTATIIMLCGYTEDGLVFTSDQTVPVEVLENEIQLMLKSRADQILPMAVDLVIVKQGAYQQVSQIQPNHIDRFKIQALCTS